MANSDQTPRSAYAVFSTMYAPGIPIPRYSRVAKTIRINIRINEGKVME